jgi:hypothetical protein
MSLALLAFVASGCLAPTLPPLPPPQAKVSAPVDGEVEISGSVRKEDAGAMVLALNNRSGDVDGQLLEDHETRFSFKLPAEIGDSVTVYYRAHGEQSEALNFIVPAVNDDGQSPGDAGP